MPVWKLTVDLKDEVRHFRTEEDIPKVAELVVAKIEASGWLGLTPRPDGLRADLAQLKGCTTVCQYTIAFDYIYDRADRDRVWIETT